MPARAAAISATTSGRRPSETELRRSVSLYNESRRMIRALYRARQQRPWDVPTEELYLHALVEIGLVLFLALVALITYVAVVTAAWIVTLWGRVLERTSYEKADAEGMLLLKDPSPMLSALGKASRSSNDVGVSDPSYDGIFYAATSGTPQVDRIEQRRYERLREVLGTEGLAAQDIGSRPS